MEKPLAFAEALLAADKGWSADQVKELWDNAVNKPVSIEHKIPVYMVYFTAVIDDAGKVSTLRRPLRARQQDGLGDVRQRRRFPHAAARKQVVGGGSRGARRRHSSRARARARRRITTSPARSALSATSSADPASEAGPRHSGAGQNPVLSLPIRLAWRQYAFVYSSRLDGFRRYAIRCASSHDAARANICDDLWVQRNSIYKAYGYCFKTPKAINYFGNAGCQYDNEGDIPSTSTHFRDQTRLSKARGPNVAPRRFANSQETAIP